MTLPSLAIALDKEVRSAWSAATDARRRSDLPMTIALIGPDAARAAQALAGISQLEAVVFSARGTRSREDWFSIEIATDRGGLPNGTEATTRGTYRIPSTLARALTLPGRRIIILTDIDTVPPDAAVGLRGVLDIGGTEFPGLGRTSPEAQVVLAAETLPEHVRRDLEGRIDIFIELGGKGPE
jgi:hypothetical protein